MLERRRGMRYALCISAGNERKGKDRGDFPVRSEYRIFARRRILSLSLSLSVSLRREISIDQRHFAVSPSPSLLSDNNTLAITILSGLFSASSSSDRLLMFTRIGLGQKCQSQGSIVKTSLMD